MTPAELKKWRERNHANEAARLLGEVWDFGPDREEPDFLIRDAFGTFGLEVTYAFSDPPGKRGSLARKSESLNHRRMQRLRADWEKTSDVILKVHVVGDIDDANEHEVLETLNSLGVSTYEIGHPGLRTETPSCLKIFVWRAFRPDWLLVNDSVGWVTQNAVLQARAALAPKAQKLERYRENVGHDVRLLIVADHSKASGMLELATPEAIDPLGFTKVYFMTSPGGPIHEITPPSA